MSKNPKTFHMIRHSDESGISGTGRILNGVVFPDGITVIRWCSNNPEAKNSTAIHDSFEAFKFLHIDCHPNNETEVVWHQKPDSMKNVSKK
jgi:hypothetical protein